MNNFILTNEKIKGILSHKKKGDINYVLGIVVVSVIMIIIVAGAKGMSLTDLISKIHDFITNTLFNHISDPFK